MTQYYTVFDLETTGLDRTKDYIIQFAAIKIDKATNKLVDSINLYIQPVGSYTISMAAYYKHKISPEFLSDKPYFSQVASQICDFLKDSDIITYNGKGFDIPFLKHELIRIGMGDKLDFTKIACYDAFLEEKRRNGNRLDDTYKRYKGKTMEEAGLVAHDALSDVKATYSVFYAQQMKQKYDAEQMFGEDNAIQIIDFDGKECPCFALGKYRGISVEFVGTFDQGYLQWATSPKSNFFESTKNYIRQFINETA